MTPAINMMKKKKIPHTIHEYSHEPSDAGYGMEAAEKMGVDPSRVFKTLVVELDTKELVVGIVPVDKQLSLKLIAKWAKGKKAQMADKDKVQRVTGYVLGGVSPIGQKKKLKTIVDESAKAFSSIYVSAGRRGLEIELSPEHLLSETQGQAVAISQV